MYSDKANQKKRNKKIFAWFQKLQKRWSKVQKPTLNQNYFKQHQSRLFDRSMNKICQNSAYWEFTRGANALKNQWHKQTSVISKQQESRTKSTKKRRNELHQGAKKPPKFESCKISKNVSKNIFTWTNCKLKYRFVIFFEKFLNQI